jgi:hypothetical protein
MGVLKDQLFTGLYGLHQDVLELVRSLCAASISMLESPIYIRLVTSSMEEGYFFVGSGANDSLEYLYLPPCEVSWGLLPEHGAYGSLSK